MRNLAITSTILGADFLWLTEEDISARQQDIQSLHTRIEMQELSAYDIDQIAQERARLTDQLHQVDDRQNEIQQQIVKDENRAVSIRDDVRTCVYCTHGSCRLISFIVSMSYASWTIKFASTSILANG